MTAVTGTIIGVNLDKGYNNHEDKGKPYTTVALDGKRESEFVLAGNLGPIGAKVEITATLIKGQ